jgi:HEPN domain-containing protein
LSKLVQEWIKKAKGDLKVARFLFEADQDFDFQIAYHCQQCAEKMIKAYLTAHRKRYPKTHDIAKLVDIVHSVNKGLAELLRQAEPLTNMGLGQRYPDAVKEPLTKSNVKLALKLAEMTFEKIAGELV